MFGYRAVNVALATDSNGCLRWTSLEDISPYGAHSLRQLPILGDCESPLKFQVRGIVIVNELRDGIVMAARYHTGWCLLLIDFGDSQRLEMQSPFQLNLHFFSYIGLPVVFGG